MPQQDSGSLMRPMSFQRIRLHTEETNCRIASFTSHSLTYKVLPLRVQVCLVGQAALHDVGAVVGAGFDGGQAATVGAEDQLHQGLHTLWTERNLRTVKQTGPFRTHTSGPVVEGDHFWQKSSTWWAVVFFPHFTLDHTVVVVMSSTFYEIAQRAQVKRSTVGGSVGYLKDCRLITDCDGPPRVFVTLSASDHVSDWRAGIQFHTRIVLPQMCVGVMKEPNSQNQRQF